MKKRLAIMVMAFVLTNFCISQISNRNAESVAIGLKGGVAMHSMAYSDKYLSEQTQDAFFAPVGGIFIGVPLGDVVSIAPEVMYVNRGVEMHYTHLSNATVQYSIASKYVDLRIPVQARLQVSELFQPYAFAGAEAGYLLGGQIHISRSIPIVMDETIDIGKANMAPYHVGAFAGLGIRSDIDFGSLTLSVRLEASYHQGFLDSYSEMENSESAVPVNVNAYNISGKRIPKGLELCLGIGIPLRFSSSDDACLTFINKYYPKHRKGVFYGF